MRANGQLCRLDPALRKAVADTSSARRALAALTLARIGNEADRKTVRRCLTDAAPVVAPVVTRIALSHALIPDDDPDLFYAELRHAAGLRSNQTNTARRRHRPAPLTTSERVS